jgi:hypothetical protein
MADWPDGVMVKMHRSEGQIRLLGSRTCSAAMGSPERHIARHMTDMEIVSTYEARTACRRSSS